MTLTADHTTPAPQADGDRANQALAAGLTAVAELLGARPDLPAFDHMSVFTHYYDGIHVHLWTTDPQDVTTWATALGTEATDTKPFTGTDGAVHVSRRAVVHLPLAVVEFCHLITLDRIDA
jgi:hypothetical protein